MKWCRNYPESVVALSVDACLIFSKDGRCNSTWCLGEAHVKYLLQLKYATARWPINARFSFQWIDSGLGDDDEV